MSDVKHRRVCVVLLTCAVVALSVALCPHSLAAPPTPAPGTTIRFSGHVYVTGSTNPITGVTIELHRDPFIRSDLSTLVGTTKTNNTGAFSFSQQYSPDIDLIYTVREINPLGFISTGAVAGPSGRVMDNDRVEYERPKAGSYSGIIFYDRRHIVPKPTITPTPTPSTDLTIKGLEVTQAIQNMANDVPLIARKRTYVRAHVKSNDEKHKGVLGEFMFSGNGKVSTWRPAANPGGRISVRRSPGRGLRDHSLYIEIPWRYVEGDEVTVVFRMNSDRSVFEVDYDNNWTAVKLDLVEMPQLDVLIHNVNYFADGKTHFARWKDVSMLASWLRRAYPVHRVRFIMVGLHWPYGWPPGFVDEYGFLGKDCMRVNGLLAVRRLLDGNPKYRRYYGMVTDSGSWMRGCSPSTPSMVASGPTGSGTWGWDTDGSYGDWYGAHELGHAFGRKHTSCTGTEDNPYLTYPYPDGKIGVGIDPNTYYGWDVEREQVYPPYWADIMSYCSWLWISDFTYRGLMTQILLEHLLPFSEEITAKSVESVGVIGQANLTQGTGELYTLYRLQGVAAQDTTPSESWALALYDAAGGELARHPFTPKADTQPEPGEDVYALIEETIPWVPGTARIAVEYKGAGVASRDVSEHAPEVTVLSPNGGERLSGDEATVRWTGSDDDGDDLVYAIQHSPDAGATWNTVAVEVTGTETLLSLELLPGSDQALLRIIASDGVNTGQDDSDGTVAVETKAPEAYVISPQFGQSYTSAQQVVLVGEGYDVEDGSLEDPSLSWRSDVDGDLGRGRHLTAEGLGAGTHTITLTATDSDGKTDSASTVVFVDVVLETIALPVVSRP